MKIYDFATLDAGELYLFFPAGNPSGGLWGMFERLDRRSGVLLSACSGDMTRFDLWTSLPSGYNCCRCASAEERERFSQALKACFACG